MPGWPTCACSYETFSSRLCGILTKSNEISPRRAGLLLIWTHLYFYKSFLRKMRPLLGELARLTEPARLHMNSSLNIWQISQENTHVGVYFKKVPDLRTETLLKRDYSTGVFLWNLWRFKNTFSTEQVRWLNQSIKSIKNYISQYTVIQIVT